MPETSNRGLPYQAPGDAPDGAALGRALAQRLDAPLPSIEVFETDGTWTKPAGLVAIKVRAVGGGGAGGGAAATGANEASVGCGGNAGVYGEVIIQAAQLGATETVTIGAGGNGVSGGAGPAGGTTSFGSHMSLPGGDGGSMETAGGSVVSPTKPPTSGGSGFDVRVPGAPGGFGTAAGTALSTRVEGGVGASSPLGAGGNGNGVGGGADGAGAGGGGAANQENVFARAGGDGANGVVIVEYIY
ncbi:hypothetical protein CLV30_1384 [Haloactinopolyspora alba]|uniref:Glycine-rich domain-containing protein n=1 Tax=Haloactinopolyspora alba TaxID=648780 RepID=A0A2P8D025_9ACTN|nr:hypothetical protein [Haloactinopolyspora alba]PSK90579.1 hypothetical protein CLV30_1384 [Haloactinopolyspora alba]